MLSKLVKIARQLDAAGLYLEADQIDILIVKIAIKKDTEETIIAQIKSAKGILSSLSGIIQGIPNQNINYKGMIEDSESSDINFSEILTEEYIESIRNILREVYKANNIFFEIKSNIEMSFRWAADNKSKSFYKKSMELIGSIHNLFEEIAEDLIPAAYNKEVPLSDSLSIKWRGVLQGAIGSCNEFLAEFAETKRIDELSKEENGIRWPPNHIPEAELPLERTEEITQVSGGDPDGVSSTGVKIEGGNKNRLAEWLKKLYS